MVTDKDNVKRVLESFRDGDIDIDTAIKEVTDPGYEDLGYAKIDHQRVQRKGFPEVIYCSGKTPEQVAEIALRLRRRNDRVLATRADQNVFDAVAAVLPDAKYHQTAKIITVSAKPFTPEYPGYVAILTGGTSDLPVAEEAAITLEVMGHAVQRVYDVGVAGIHRLLAQQPTIDHANVVIAVAGMEGALASVVSGLTDKPVIAVPTSTGYGANFNGIAPLLAMLNSCASGVTVCNIDNGFGAGYSAALMNRMAAQNQMVNKT